MLELEQGFLVKKETEKSSTQKRVTPWSAGTVACATSAIRPTLMRHRPAAVRLLQQVGLTSTIALWSQYGA